MNSVFNRPGIYSCAVDCFLDLHKFGYDNSSWPLYVSNIHSQPGRLNCKDCRCLSHEPFNTSVVNSKFLFIEFSPEIRESVIMYDKIKVGNSFYTLKALVRCSGAHFTCSVQITGKWLYFDDLRPTVREFASKDSLKQCIPGGWFFAVFELINESGCVDEIAASVEESKNMLENRRIFAKNDGARNQSVADDSDESKKESKIQHTISTKDCEEISANNYGRKRSKPAPQQKNGNKSKKKTKFERKKSKFSF
jgi:hypothetical protein